MLKLLLALGIAAVAWAAYCLWDSRTPRLSSGQIRGAWLAASGAATLDSPAGLDALRRLAAAGVDTVAMFPEVTMQDITRPGLTFGEHDGPLRATLRAAKSVGLATFVLPRIESPAFFAPPHPWRADIKMADPADWPRFFDDLARVVRHYGALAREEGAAIFGIGLEYRAAVRENPDAWRSIAAAAKAAFGGPITYSANWDDYTEVVWWDAVDLIGIGAYFELVDDGIPDDVAHADRARARLPAPTLSRILDGWKPIAAELEAFSRRHDRPIFFTEVGYTTFADTAYYPWMWQSTRPVDPSQQALCYRALFKTFAGCSWWKGACLWRFYTDPSAVEGWNYSPQGHAAERVMRAAYRR